MSVRACIMGHPVAHSRSPLLHGHWLETLQIDGAYDRIDLKSEAFADFFRALRQQGYVGGNVTIPYKEAAFRLVDRREPAAAAIGAVNTVWYENDVLVGDNTDWLGLLASLDAIHPGWDASAQRVAVLGAGLRLPLAAARRGDREPHARAGAGDRRSFRAEGLGARAEGLGFRAGRGGRSRQCDGARDGGPGTARHRPRPAQARRHRL
jgi:hypothetical protein